MATGRPGFRSTTPTTRSFPAASARATAIQGREAAWAFYAAIAQTLQARAFLDDIELESAGPDKVLAHQHGPVRGQASGAQVDLDLRVVGSFRAGKIVRDEWFATRDEAVEAAGLSE